MDHGDRIPAKAHRVAQNQLRFRPQETEVSAALSAVANQSIDVL